MINLSTRTKEAIKTGLAVVVAYAISLNLGWEKPFWAAFAVVMISLDTAGASLNKAALRMLGTLMGGAAGLFLFALFSQQRWLMMLSLSAYYGFCTYMMTGSKRPYFWLVGAFVCMVVMIDASPTNSLGMFRIVTARVQENAMGILVYSLISIFLWPRSSSSALYEASRKLSATQRRIFQTYRGLMKGQGTAGASQPLHLQEVQQLTGLAQALNAAKTDSYEVWEVRRQWRRFHELSISQGETFERWRESFAEIQSLDLKRLMPNLASFCSELEDRFAEIDRMLCGEAPATMPQPIRLTIDHEALRPLAHFQRAALAQTKTQLDGLETLSRSLFDCVQDIKGFASQRGTSQRIEDRTPGLTLDPDRFAGTLLVMAAQWTGFLIWVYADPPGHAMFVFQVAQWTLLCVMLRSNPLSLLLPGFVIGIALGGVVYVFVMPHLSGYLDLGLMLFAVTFGAFCLLSGGTRSASMANFHILVGINNQQTYDFANFLNTSAAMLLSLACVILLYYAAKSPRPEKVFLRRLRRFFRQAEFLMSRLALDRDDQQGRPTRWRMSLYCNDLLEIPDKLAALGRQIDDRLLAGQTTTQVQDLANSLHALAYRIKELVEARKSPQNDLLVAAVIDDMRAWRLLAQKQLRLWADDPAQAVEPGVDLRDRLAARFSRMEAKIGKTRRGIQEGQLSERDYENFYRYLGALRGVSESGIAYERIAQGIDWALWKEARF
jgi:uncharacterized membrane protein YccC